MMPWRSLLARAVAVGAIVSVFVGGAVFVSVKFAAADPGLSGGPTRSQLTFAGVLRERAMTRTVLTFAFSKGGTRVCTSETPPFTPDSAGAFSVLVPIDAPSRCPAQLFDGAEVAYEVMLATDGGSELLTPMPVPVTPVPYARFADQAGVNNDCPAGYTRDTGVTGASPPIVVCFNTNAPGHDDVVKVGSGASAFWVDRYEASVIDRSGRRQDTLSGILSDNGQWVSGTRESLLAVSFSGVRPSVNITWFQARALCRASGKRLMTRDEWFSAADGLATSDALTPSTGINGNVAGESRCNTGGVGPRQTGSGTACASSWGVQDLIGNVDEWTDEWFSGAGGTTMLVNLGVSPWPPPFAGDTTSNIAGFVDRGGGGVAALPAAALRGGHYEAGGEAGVFRLDLTNAPSNRGPRIGFRCVVSR